MLRSPSATPMKSTLEQKLKIYPSQPAKSGGLMVSFPGCEEECQRLTPLRVSMIFFFFFFFLLTECNFFFSKISLPI